MSAGIEPDVHFPADYPLEEKPWVSQTDRSFALFFMVAQAAATPPDCLVLALLIIPLVLYIEPALGDKMFLFVNCI